ncbi:unknown [Prevotella sp. CAG:487]|nr:unknown [Prevotella sp. CAG:487]
MITPKRITVHTDSARLSDCPSSTFTWTDNTGIGSPALHPDRQKGGNRPYVTDYIQCKHRGGDRNRFLKDISGTAWMRSM